MSEYTRIKSELDCWYHCDASNPRWESYINAEDVKTLIDIIEKYRGALQLIDMIGDGEVCSFIRNFKEAKKVIEKMRITASGALKLTEE